VITSVHLC